MREDGADGVTVKLMDTVAQAFKHEQENVPTIAMIYPRKQKYVTRGCTIGKLGVLAAAIMTIK